MKKFLSIILSVIIAFSVMAEMSVAFAAVPTITTNKSYSESFSYYGDDWNRDYRLNITSTSLVTVEASSPTASVRIKITDLDDDYYFMYEYFDNNQTKFQLYLTAGTYAVNIMVDDVATVKYKFSASPVEESFAESITNNNNTYATASTIQLGQTYKGIIINDNTDKVDIYKLSLAESSKVTLYAEADDDMYFKIYDEQAVKEDDYLDAIYANENSNAGKYIANKSIRLTSGTYYIVAHAFSNVKYSFNVNAVSANETFKESGRGTNNTLNQACNIVYGTTYKGQIGKNDHVDFYKFTLLTRATVGIYAVTEGDDWTRIKLLNANGSEIDSFYGNKNYNNQYVINDSRTLAAGTYYMMIGDEYWDDSIEYTLRITKNCNHSYYTTYQSNATCTANGYRNLKCSYCGVTKVETLYAPGHSYSTKVTKAPTSSKTGVMTYTCTRCNTKTTKSIAKLANASISKLTASKKGFKAQWKKVSSATGYQIRYSTSSKMSKAKTVTITKNSTLSKSITKLSAKKKYYVQIRTYKTINGTKYYSSWSKAKAITTKK